MSAYILDQLREQAELKVHNIRATKAWVLHDKRTRYAITLLESLKERHGGYIYQAIDADYVYVSYNLSNLTGLKDPKLDSLLNSLLHADSEKQETSDYAAGMMRTYKFYWYDPDNRDHYMIVTVEASFGEDSDTCRKIVVGYKPAVEPQPIYKLTCEGEETTLIPTEVA
jgi:hypothetical protein